MNADRDLEFGKAAVERGLLTLEQLAGALGRLAKERDAGGAGTLAQLVVREGLVKPEDAEALLAAVRSDGRQDGGATPEVAPATSRLPREGRQDGGATPAAMPPPPNLTAPSPDARTLPTPTPTPTPPPGARAGSGAAAASDGEKGSSTFERKYAVAGELARGGMGIVLTGKDLAIRREVAIKVLKAGAKAAPEQVAKFVEEAQIQGQLEHPNICPVHELGVDARGRPYFAMKKVKGRSLAEILSELRGDTTRLQVQPQFQLQANFGEGEAPAEPPGGGGVSTPRPPGASYSLSQLLEIFLKVCDAVAFAHSKGVIHRDLKPENIMVGEFGEVLVMDWGLAKIAGLPDRHEKELVATDRTEGGGVVSLEGTIIGTPAYMPPEQARGEVDKIDERSDIYALGGILYAILTLRAPFEGGDVREILEKVRKHDLVTPSQRARGPDGRGSTPARTPLSHQNDPAASRLDIDKDQGIRATVEGRPSGPTRIVPPDLQSACLKAMSARKEDRYATVQSLKSDIQAFLEGRTLAAARYTFAQLAKLWVKRNKVFAATAGAAAAILLAATGFYVVSVTQARGEAVRHAEHATAAEAESRRHAEHAKAEAERAKAEAERARAAETEATRRVADSLVAEGNALGEAGRWADAEARHKQAYDVYQRIGVPPIAADLGLLDVYRNNPPPLMTLTGHTAAVRSVAFSPDGRLALSAGDDKSIRIWDARTGLEIRNLLGHAGAVTGAVFAPDGSQILSGSLDGNLRLWDVATGREVRAFRAHAGGVTSIAVSADGKALASGGKDGTLKIWNAATGKEMKTFHVHTLPVTAMSISPDFNVAVTGSQDERSISVWDLHSGARLHHSINRSAQSFSFHPRQRQVLAGDLWSGSATLFDAGSGQVIKTLAGHAEVIYAITVSSSGEVALTGSGDKTAKLWRLDTGAEVHTLHGHGESVTAVALSPDGHFALTGSDDHTVRFWDLTGGQCGVVYYKAHQAGVRSLKFSPDGCTVLSCSGDGTVKHWDVATSRLLQEFRGHTGFGDVVFSPDGHTIASVGGDGMLRFWSVATNLPIRSVPCGRVEQPALAVSPDWRMTATTSKRLTIFDNQTGREIRSFPYPTNGPHSLAFSPDGKRLGAFCGDRIKEWDVETWRETRTIQETHGGTQCLAYTEDGRGFVAAGQDQKLRVWDLDTGRCVREMSGHFSALYDLALLPNTGLAVSGSRDSTLRIWDLSRGRELHTYRANKLVYSVAVSPDGRIMASGGRDDASVMLWNLVAPSRYRDFEQRLARARNAWQAHHDEVSFLAALGEWYAFRGVWDWAVEFLEKARSGGVQVSALELGRCYWQLGNVASARREFESALSAGEAPEFYLKLCIQALNPNREVPTVQREVFTLQREVSALLGATPQQDGLWLCQYEDGLFEAATVEGKSCVKTAPNNFPQAGRHLYFDVDDNFLRKPTGVDVLVEYFDGGAGQFCVQYDSSDASAEMQVAFKPTKQVRLSGTNTWKSATFHLPDAAFQNRQQGLFDFRIDAGPEELYVHRVAVLRSTQASPPPPAQHTEKRNPVEKPGNPDALEAVLAETFDEMGVSLMDTEADGKFSKTVQGEKPCVKTTTEGVWKYLCFDVLDGWRREGGVEVTIEYFDGPSGSLRIDYDSLDEESGARDHNDAALGGRYKTTRPVPLGGSQQWKTAAFDLPDPRFEGRQNGGADFRIATDADLYVHRVAVRRIAGAAEPK